MDRERAFGRWFLLAILAYFLLYVNGSSNVIFQYDEYGDALFFFEFGTAMAFGAPLMPLIAALPFATSFATDFSAGCCPLIVLRGGKGRYLRSKALHAALSGGAAVALGMALFVLLLNLMYPQDVSQPLMMGGASDLLPMLSASGPLPLIGYYLGRAFLQFMAGAWWALAALAFSAFYPNLSLTLCAPLVLYRLAAWIGQLPFMPAFLNITWLDDAQVGLPPHQALLMGALVYGTLSLLASLVFQWRAGRRLRYA